MLAHICQKDGSRQSLQEHCNHVRALSKCAGAPLGLEQLAQLIGILHDMGKACSAFQDYLLYCANPIEKTPPKHPHHAATGAVFAYIRWFSPVASIKQRLTAQLVAHCIHAHHTGLADSLDCWGGSPFLEGIQDGKQYVSEAAPWFFENVISEEKLDALFLNSCKEVERFCAKSEKGRQALFTNGMLARLLLSILVDADRWDSACFEYGQSPLISESKPQWTTLLDTFEAFRKEKLSGKGELNQIRAQISEECYQNAGKAQGIYILSVPTGGGKTFSSLRYALAHAQEHDLRRIFYIIPFNTILDQNAQDIRLALENYDGILEHHSNVVLEDAEAEEDYRRLTERWDSPIILTSLVQFLNACFSGRNTDARRLHRLSNAVLIFDEIQSLPKHCKALFEAAITFLTQCCGATVLLCTATQPELNLATAPTEIVPSVEHLFHALARVNYFPDLKPKTNEEAAQALVELIDAQSVLMIVNTKAVAWELHQQVTERLTERGLAVIHADSDAAEENILSSAENADEHTVLCVHLTTLLCPKHRLALLKWVKLWTKLGKQVFCVSTALIEAGINVSFPVVVRSLTGLPSIVQAAGRCNRNMEYPCGKVFLWSLREEHLSRLPDIVNGGDCTRGLLAEQPTRWDAPATITRYFQLEHNYTKSREAYPVTQNVDYRNRTLVELLTENGKCRLAYQERTGEKVWKRMALHQSFRTAGKEFQVIPESTRTVLVPYGAGKELITELNGDCTLPERRLLLRKAQQYSVSVYENFYRRLLQEDAIYPIADGQVLALREGYYSEAGGVLLEREELELIDL